MIILSVGNIGSGKTVSEVRNMCFCNNIIYSNIETKLKNQKNLTSGMIIEKKIVGHKKNNSPVYDLKLNTEFWKKVPKPVTIILDEVHTLMNSRRSMSKINILFTEWLSLLRRILGSTTHTGDLIMITQLNSRIDIIAREMAHQVRYHICHFKKSCTCGASWNENSEMPEQLGTCPTCGGRKIKIHDHKIELRYFSGINNFLIWKNTGIKSWYKHFLINDIEKFFPLYDTYQWDNMFSNLY